MKKIDLIKELEKYPVFNLKILREIINKDRNYAKIVIYRLKKDNLIFEIEKDKYTTLKEAIVVASNLIWPSYLSCWTALRYYNLTEQLPKNIFVITTKSRKKRTLEFNNSQIIFIKAKTQYFFGYNKEHYGNFDIFIAKKEKAIIDSLYFKQISLSEIYEVIKNSLNEFDSNIFIDYLIKIKNKALIKRLGFLLDLLDMDLYDKLKRHINYQYIPLDYAISSKGKKNKKWRVIENVKLN